MKNEKVILFCGLSDDTFSWRIWKFIDINGGQENNNKLMVFSNWQDDLVHSTANELL